MKSTALIPSEYIAQLPEDRKAPIQKLRQTILERLDPKFHEKTYTNYVLNYSRFDCDAKI